MPSTMWLGRKSCPVCSGHWSCPFFRKGLALRNMRQLVITWASRPLGDTPQGMCLLSVVVRMLSGLPVIRSNPGNSQQSKDAFTSAVAIAAMAAEVRMAHPFQAWQVVGP